MQEIVDSQVSIQTVLHNSINKQDTNQAIQPILVDIFDADIFDLFLSRVSKAVYQITKIENLLLTLQNSEDKDQIKEQFTQLRNAVNKYESLLGAFFTGQQQFIQEKFESFDHNFVDFNQFNDLYQNQIKLILRKNIQKKLILKLSSVATFCQQFVDNFYQD